MENKKIRNATPTIVNGIQFKSRLEATFFFIMHKKGFIFVYEKEAIVTFLERKLKCTAFILRKDKLVQKTKLSQRCYTPDGYLEYKGKIIYVELKGYPNDSYTIRRDLFLNKIADDTNVYFFEIKRAEHITYLINFLTNLQ